MRDPLVHVERTLVPGFGQAEMRNLVAGVLGLAGDLPKTCGTGCGKRRPLASTSKDPAKVTCLPCRDYAREQHAEQARLARDLLQLMEADPGSFGGAKVTPEQLREAAKEHERQATAYGPPETRTDG